MHRFVPLLLLALGACSDDVSRKPGDAAPEATPPGIEAGTDAPLADLPPPRDGGEADGPTGDLPATAPDGGGYPPGNLLFSEGFEDTSFSARGWYDAPKGTLSTTDVKEGKSAFVCLYKQGTTSCAGGTPGRRLFTPSESIFVSYWVKYSASWVGSGKAYHPHEFNVVTDADDKYIGPGTTHLTLYIEQVGGRPLLALQDSLNVDLGCVLLNDGSFVGCNGSFTGYAFSEKRSVCACNGIVGDLDRKDCFKAGAGYYSARMWDAPDVYFKDQAGPYYKGDWHLVEAYFEMNSISGGKGVPDGKIRYWYDGTLLISSDKILMRTGDHPTQKFNQFLFGNHIGDGSPVDQTMWVDKLVVGTGKP